MIRRVSRLSTINTLKHFRAPFSISEDLKWVEEQDYSSRFQNSDFPDESCSLTLSIVRRIPITQMTHQQTNFIATASHCCKLSICCALNPGVKWSNRHFIQPVLWPNTNFQLHSIRLRRNFCGFIAPRNFLCLIKLISFSFFRLFIWLYSVHIGKRFSAVLCRNLSFPRNRNNRTSTKSSETVKSFSAKCLLSRLRAGKQETLTTFTILWYYSRICLSWNAVNWTIWFT